MSDPAGSKAAEGGSTTFWKTVPGILTGLAALVTAIGGLIVVLVQVFGTPGQDPPADTGTHVNGESAIAETAATTAGTAGPAGSLLRSDQVEMNADDWIDLEAGKVGKWVATSDFVMIGSDRFSSTPYPTTVVSGPITKAACAAALDKRDDGGAAFSEIEDDQWMCVETEEKHLAGVRIVKRPTAGDPVAGLDYVIWK